MLTFNIIISYIFCSNHEETNTLKTSNINNFLISYSNDKKDIQIWLDKIVKHWNQLSQTQVATQDKLWLAN